jgi:glycolate oxidase subunit GlcD
MRTANKFLKAQREVARLIGKENILTDAVSLSLNSFDGSPVRAMPDVILNIPSAEVLQEVIKILNKYKIYFVPRTAASNQDGGAIALKGGCILNLSALDKIILIDTSKKYSLVESGVINQRLQDALKPLGYFYAPDPASMAFSTIGGNCALGAGGAKTLKYGASAANVLKAELITATGERLILSKADNGPDLLSLLLRSEGTLSILTKLWVKITPAPCTYKTVLAYFPTLENAMQTVKDIIAAGILPSALEGMDKTTMDATQTPYPQGMEAMLILELDSKKQYIEEEFKPVEELCRKNKALKVEPATSEDLRTEIWAKRKSAASSLVKLAANLISLDCALPRAKLPEVIIKIRNIFKKYNARAGLVFHAGDGNLHPNIVFDETNLFEVAQVKKAVKEINAVAIEAGGSISGEHGIGVEKRAAMALMFDESALTLFRKIKQTIDPLGLANPDKMLPVATVSQRKNAQRPQYLEKLSNTIKQNYKNGKPVIIAGLNTKLKADKKDILDISALNEITDIDKINYTVTAAAATPLKALAGELAAHKMYLPIPETKGTIGGVFAAKTYPGLEDFVTGLDFILPDGTFISIGGKNVKNAAGYDLIRFLTGSQGAYALITALTIRTFADKPPAQKQNPFEVFIPREYHVKLKKIFDDKNIFNSFIFKEAQNADETK